MALKGFLINIGGGFPQFGWGQLNYKHFGSVRKVRVGSVSVSSDENPSNSTPDLQKSVYSRESSVTKKVQNDLNLLPRPLSVTDFSTSSTNRSKVRISFKGHAGAYSEDAALKAYPQCETFPCEEFEDTIKAVELWLADRAILPIENSLSGCIHRNYDLLLRHRLHIVGEIQLAVNFSLLALPDVRLEQLKRVLSHPQALDQCNAFLNKLGVLREYVNDAAGAAQHVASNRMMDAGIVASARVAELYGFNILAERIQDDYGNITRFLVLARDPIIPRTDKPFKTSIVFTLDEGPGVLFKALAVFALRDISLTKIESRPQRNQPLRVVDDSNTGTSKCKIDGFKFLVLFQFSNLSNGTKSVNEFLLQRNQIKCKVDSGIFELCTSVSAQQSILITFSTLISRHLWQNLVHNMLCAICRSLRLSSEYLAVIPWTRLFRFLLAFGVF